MKPPKIEDTKPEPYMQPPPKVDPKVLAMQDPNVAPPKIDFEALHNASV